MALGERNTTVEKKTNNSSVAALSLRQFLDSFSEVQGADVVHEWSPAPTPVLVVLCLLVAVAGYATLVEIVGRVGGIHYPGATPGEQVTLVVILAVVLLPVDAVAVIRKGKIGKVWSVERKSRFF